MPDTIRDAVLMGASELSQEARAAAEAAAVAGEIVRPGACREPVQRRRSRRARRARAGRGGRRRSGRVPPRPDAARRSTPTCPGCTGEPCTAGSPRRSRRGGGQSMEVATQWLGSAGGVARAGGAPARGGGVARRARVPRRRPRRTPGARAVARGRRAERRIEALEAYARSAELSRRAGRGGPGVARDLRRPARPARERLAGAQRRLAADPRPEGRSRVGRSPRGAPPPRRYAAGGQARRGSGRAPRDRQLPARAGATRPAIELAETAGGEAAQAERLDLRARALGLEGVARAQGAATSRAASRRSAAASPSRSSTT